MVVISNKSGSLLLNNHVEFKGFLQDKFEYISFNKIKK